MWEDMGIYWAWRGTSIGYCAPPTEKRRFHDGRNTFGADYTAIARCVRILMEAK